MKILQNERGGALLITLLVMVMLTLAGIMAVNTANDDMDMSFNQVNSDQAFYVAEAGLEHTLYELNEDNDWRTGFHSERFKGGAYTVTMRDSLVDTLLFDTVLVNARGRVLGANSIVEAYIVPVWKHPWALAMFGDSWINLDQQTCTDSWASDSGSYASTHLDSLGSVGTNGTITSSKEVDFGGDVFTATPGGISLGASNTVNGDTSSTVDSVQLDAVSDATYDWAKANSNAPAGLSGAGYTYNNGSKDLVAGAYGNIILAGGVYYFDDIILGQYSTITVAPGASVEIYMNGNFDLGQGSTVNVGGLPTDFFVFSRGDSLTFHQDNIFYGAFYGPNAHIQYDQTTQVYGALVGNTIKLDKGACFHYDRALGRVKKGTTGEMYIAAWREL
jgi:hypothetical protein